jgi:hypothetical protein
VIAYRDSIREVTTAAELSRLRELACGRDTENLLISAGELEQGIADALHPLSDGWGPVQALLRDAVCAAAAAHLDSMAGRPVAGALSRLRSLLATLRRRHLPATIAIKAPEGFLHYALDPAGHAASAALYATRVGWPRATRAGIVGLRSIGTSLSAVVAAALKSARSVTVRPHGLPGNRCVVADARLQARVAGWASVDADILIVDEGPGATGESFACVAAWLRALGIDPDRMVLFPHHASGMSLAPHSRRTWYAAMRKHIPPDDRGHVHQVASALGLVVTDDLSAGRWRTVVPETSALPSCPHHERRKYRARGPDGAMYMLRYAGRGRWGRATVERALRLAELGIGPRVHGHAGGFIAVQWIEGRPVRAAECREPAFGQSLCAYLAARAGRFSTGEPVDDMLLIGVLTENTREVLGPDPPGLSVTMGRIERLPRREAVIADARLLRHEWLSTPMGYAKVDVLDHGDGIRPPGPMDAAWDLAGAAVEYSLDEAAVAALCSRCAPACERSASELAAAVAAYRAPYAACCLGEMSLSAREAGAPADRQRLRWQAARYVRALRRELDRVHAQQR